MTKPDFEVVWRRIVALEGETFTQIRGGEFTYRVHGDALGLDRTNQDLTKTQVAEAYELAPLTNTVPVQHLRGPSYLYALIMDDRVRQGGW